MKELSKKELVEIRGGGPWAVIGLGILAAAIYEHGKHFVTGLLNPYESNEN